MNLKKETYSNNDMSHAIEPHTAVINQSHKIISEDTQPVVAKAVDNSNNVQFPELIHSVSHSQASHVAANTQASTVATHSQASLVATHSQSSLVATHSQASLVVTHSQASTAATHSQTSNVSTHLQTLNVTTHLQTSRVSTHPSASHVYNRPSILHVPTHSSPCPINFNVSTHPQTFHAFTHLPPYVSTQSSTSNVDTTPISSHVSTHPQASYPYTNFATSNVSTHPAKQLHSENGRNMQSYTHPMYGMHTSAKHVPLQNPNHQKQLNKEKSFDGDRINVQKQHSSKLLIEDKLENRLYTDSELKGYMGVRPGKRWPFKDISYYMGRHNPSISGSKSLMELSNPPFIETDPNPSNNLMLSHIGSMLPDTGTLISTPISRMPEVGSDGLIDLSFNSAKKSGRNSFGNDNLFLPTLDTGLQQEQATGDEKGNKTIQERKRRNLDVPFKDAINESLSKKLRTMGLSPTKKVKPREGYVVSFKGHPKDSSESSQSSAVPKEKSVISLKRRKSLSASCPRNDAEAKQSKTDSDDSGCSNPGDTSVIKKSETDRMRMFNIRRFFSLQNPEDYPELPSYPLLPKLQHDDSSLKELEENDLLLKMDPESTCRYMEELTKQVVKIQEDSKFKLQMYLNNLLNQYKLQMRSITKRYLNSERQLNLLNEKLGDGRCSNCGWRLKNNTTENGIVDLSEVVDLSKK